MICLNFDQLRRGGLTVDVTTDAVFIEGTDEITEGGIEAFRHFATEIGLNEYDSDEIIGLSIHRAMWSRVRDITMEGAPRPTLAHDKKRRK